jgi:hypothetical protein
MLCSVYRAPRRRTLTLSESGNPMREGQRITFCRRRMPKCSSSLARKISLLSFLTIRTAVVVDLEGIMLSTSSDRIEESIVEGREESISAPCLIPALSIYVVVLFLSIFVDICLVNGVAVIQCLFLLYFWSGTLCNGPKRLRLPATAGAIEFVVRVGGYQENA